MNKYCTFRASAAHPWTLDGFTGHPNLNIRGEPTSVTGHPNLNIRSRPRITYRFYWAPQFEYSRKLINLIGHPNLNIREYSNWFL